jgi:hypothetical protein
VDLEALRQRIAEILAALAAENVQSVPADDLAGYQDELLDLFNAARAIGGADALAEATRAVELSGTVRDEIARRETAAAEEQAAFDALAAQLAPAEEPDPEAEPEAEAEGAEEAEGADPPAADESVAPAAQAEEPPPAAPVAPAGEAAAPVLEPVAAGAASVPRQSAPASAVAASRAAAPVTAAARQARPGAGVRVSGERKRDPGPINVKMSIVGPSTKDRPKVVNLEAVTAAFHEAHDYWGRTANGVEMNIPVLHIEWDYPDDMDLRPLGDDAVSVTAALDRKFNALDQAPWGEAITASGGICAPYPMDYGLLPVIGETQRPVAGALPTFQATRGGVRWMGGYSLSDILVNAGAGSSISQYTKQNDIDAVTKPCQTFTCKTESFAEVYALLRCFQFGNWNARFYPEMIDQVLGYAMIAYAKYAETLLIQGIGAGSTQVDYNGNGYQGFTVSLLSAIERATTFFRARYRAPGFGALRVGLPWWVRGVVREDLRMRMATGNDQFNVPDGFIDGLIRQSGGDPWYFLDAENDVQSLTGPQLQGALRDWPNTVVFYVFPEGTWVRLDAGELDLGIVRDSTLNSKNNFQMFYEAWEGLMMRGYESLRVNATLCANGASAGTYPPEPCVS